MRKFQRWFVAIAIASLIGANSFAPALGQDGTPQSTDANNQVYPLSIENCGRTLTFAAPPERAVLGYQPIAELFVGLGLSDHAIGRASSPVDAPDLPELAEDFASIPVVSSTVFFPPREQLLALRPDFLLAYGDFDVGGDNAGADGLATLEQLGQANIPVYFTICPDPSGNYVTENLDATYRTLRDLGTIFGVQQQAEQRIADMQAQIASVQERLAGIEPADTLIYAGGEGPLYISGGLGMNDELLTLAGGRNVFPELGQWAEVSKEAISAVEADAYMVFGEFTEDGSIDASALTSFLFSTFPNQPASINQRVAVTAYQLTAPGWRNAQTVEDLARQLHPGAFG